MTPRTLALLACLAAVWPAGRAGAAEPAPKARHVVVILTDDLGYADLGCYGSKDIRTPNVDRLAKEGTRLTDFYSNGPVCTPTRAALMTGRWQQRVGLEWAIFPGQKGPGLPTSETALPRMLKGAGYKTGMVGKWHLGYKKEFGPNAHGFDTFFGLLSGNVDHYSHKEINGEPDWYEDAKPVVVKGYSSDLITDRAVAFLDKNARSPFFLYVAYNAVHWPFQAPDRPADVRTRPTWFDGTRKDYAAMMERVDAGVGKILAALDKHGLAKDTLVIFTNDNGGERLSDNRPFSQRKGTLWEGGIRVPCLLRWPGQVPAGKASPVPALTMDLTATVLAACGTAPPRGRKLDGVNLLPVLRGGAAPERAFFWRIDRKERKQKAVRQGKWKYLRDGASERLYDLSRDPGERTDLAGDHPDTVRESRQKLAAWEKEMAAEKPLFQVK
jgi:arylsulfatase A-like enzyme